MAEDIKVYLATKEQVNQRAEEIKNEIRAVGKNVNGFVCDPVYFAIRKDRATGGVELRWRDPEDGTIAQKRGVWANTTVVRKLGSAPTSIDDGDVVISSATRNQFAVNPYFDSTGTSEHVYRAFPMSIGGIVEEEHQALFKPFVHYGFYIDETDPVDATCVHYIEDNTGFDRAFMDHDTGTFDIGSWANAFFMGKPCMLHYADANHDAAYVDYYLDPDDLTKKEDGSDSILAQSSANQQAYSGNAMQEFPDIFLKVYKEGSRVYVHVSDTKIDDGYECWNTKKADGTYGGHFYLPLFEGTVLSGKLRSLATGAKPTGNTNSTSELDAAKQNGEGWYPTLWADEVVTRALFYLVFGRTQSREALGCCTTNTAGSLQLNCGALKDKGSFWGRRLDNVSPYTGIKFFNMENWWSHRWRRSLGFTTVNYKIFVKMTPSKIDGSNVDDFLTSDSDVYTGNYIDTGKTFPSASYAFISKIHGEGLAAFAPKEVSGASNTTYMCDPCWSSTGVRGGYFGGSCVGSQLSGVGASYLAYAPSIAGWALGASLSYHPL